MYITNAACALIRVGGGVVEQYTVRAGWVPFTGTLPTADYWQVDDDEAVVIWRSLNDTLGPRSATPS